MQADSLNITPDTIVTDPVTMPVLTDTVISLVDTISESEPSVVAPEPITETPAELPKPQITSVVENIDVPSDNELIAKDSIQEKQEELSSVHLFANLRNSDSSLISITPQSLDTYNTQTGSTQIIPIEKNSVRVFEKEWVFGISVFAVLLIIIVRIFYQKYLTSIISSLVNIQLAEKILRERNVLNRRVNLLLNICSVMSLSFLVYIAIERYQMNGPSNNSFYNFLFINLVVIGVLLTRLLLTKLTGAIFDSVPVYKEYHHNSLIIYKNLGLYLLPLMVSYFFVSESLAPVIYVAGLVLFFSALLMRYIKAIQIIIRHNIFLFYSILYLCTLEILPTLIGIKFVLTLR